MTDENLERRLRTLSAPELPESWRGEILTEARRQASASPQNREVWPTLLVYLRNLFARNPFTAGALTALWLLIFLFQATTPVDPSSRMLIAASNSHCPLYPVFIPEEVRLALLGQEDDDSAEKRLRP